MNTLWRFSATLLAFLSLFKASRSHSGTKVLSADEITKVNTLVSSLPKYHIKLTHIKVHTYFHVITDGSIGKVHDMQLHTQMRVLNERFSSIGISFKLIDVTYTNNADWYYNCWKDGNEQKASFEMKAALRSGGKSALNVYFVDLKDGPTGYSSFPWDISTEGLMKDGIVMNNRAIPGGSRQNYNMGVQLVHELGHWLGLLHVFPPETDWGVCRPDEDEVPDTPATAYPSDYGLYGLCPINRDSCPGLPGKDPVTNYMDYSADWCLTHFTNGQKKRMYLYWIYFRHKRSKRISGRAKGSKGKGHHHSHHAWNFHGSYPPQSPKSKGKGSSKGNKGKSWHNKSGKSDHGFGW